MTRVPSVPTDREIVSERRALQLVEYTEFLRERAAKAGKGKGGVSNWRPNLTPEETREAQRILTTEVAAVVAAKKKEDEKEDLNKNDYLTV